MDKEFIIKKITKVNAEQICSWKYEKPYDLYNMDANAVNELMSNNYYEVVNNEKQLIGYFCFGKEAQVPGWNYDDESIDIGLGLNPSLTSKGLGTSFVMAGIKYAKQNLNEGKFRLTVATFNERAIKTYKKLGFITCGEFKHSKTNKPFYIMKNQYK
jgi:[ribosomal protein S18]-alanine N-acetyltransferase